MHMRTPDALDTLLELSSEDESHLLPQKRHHTTLTTQPTPALSLDLQSRQADHPDIGLSGVPGQGT
ncbi:hypothetical protein JVT61DRAFT_15477 [Boletus reticuloceps]|uniref:Uncharacterized protein n=1 Tax=Boletus reticuloceps TaxID=495285 RepID=A0A8I2YCD4_9AGAM|nr:hypothetical protein JVT61DRAFT_15477 [Boletus reticuloceps]